MSVLKEDDDEEENGGGITIKASEKDNQAFSAVDQFFVFIVRNVVILVVKTVYLKN